MIDTDKYEGHTPAPWGRDYDSVFEYGGEDIARLTLGNGANEQLIVDAPLLLAEVKRLRQIIQVQIVTPRSKQFFMQHYGKGDFEEQWKKWADEIQDKVWGRKE